MIRVAVITLGCPKNQVESEYMLGILEKNHLEVVSDPRQAEVVIINTCSFITAAREEALDTILELARAANHPRLIVAGCLAQQYASELWQELPEAAAFIGPGATGRLPEIINRVLKGERVLDVPSPEMVTGELPRLIEDGKPFAYLKIAEGCNNRCTYCTIPSIKGPYRSRPLEKVVAEAVSLAARGIKELVLVAQDTTAYGLDCYGEYRLPELLRRLARIEGIEWVRLLYAYPTRITPELIEVMATEPGVVPYLDLPLQHASEGVLRRMGRPGTGAAGLRAIESLRRAIPEITIRSTFIVGFPGEEEQDFQILLDFLTDARLDWVGAFKFSPEEGTVAAGLPGQVPEEVKEERYQRLMLHQQSITRACNEGWLGREVQVLKEGPEVGRSMRQAPEVDGVVYVKGDPSPTGSMVTVKLTHLYNIYDFLGEIKA
ncbi:MAG: ribosomal protein methylthiotransferase [Moorella sp. (in: firmicutes)]|nr:ribosomal protein methylthiotransferase [Moorella sp. (in: firmicutes)]